jgi:hypothetical protein
LGKRIPNEIKNKVLDSWLFGIPSNVIATCNGIGYGSVFRIIESFKSKIPDLDLLRAVTVMIKQEGLSLSDVTSGIRIKIFLEQMGSSEIEMERLLTEIDIHSFKTNQTFSNFVKEIHEIIDSHRHLEFLFMKSMIMLNIRKKNYELCKLN